MLAGADLIIIGKPGAGKTFALNHLTTRLARSDQDLGELAELIPVLVHAADLILPSNHKNLLDVLYDAINEKVSAVVEAQLTSFYQNIFEQNKAILMIDGLDELPAESHKPCMEFLVEVKEKYPEVQIILTGSTEQIPYHPELDFHIVPLTSWDTKRRSEYIYKWAELWDKHVLKEKWAKGIAKPMDATLVDGWLYQDSSNTNPLYLTLKLWAIYAGDLTGTSVAESLNAYVRRMSNDISNARKALEQLAAQIVLSLTPMVERKQAGKFVSQFEDPSAPSDIEEEMRSDTQDLFEEDEDDDFELIGDDLDELDDLELNIPVLEKTSKKKGKSVSARGVRRMLPEMVKNHLLVYRSDGRIGFSHPVVSGYLAGCGLATVGGEQQLIAQPNWSGKRLSLQFLASRANVTQVISQMINQSKNDSLRGDLLSLGEWPSTAPANQPWRGTVMKGLATALNEPNLPLGLRGRILSALAFSGDPGVAALFRQLLASPQPEVQMLGALGSGIVRDASAAKILNELLYNPVPNVRRASCLAMVSIDTSESIEMVATALLQGEDDARKAAAEALSKHPDEGHSLLKEGAEIDDLSVRRAVAFGLGWIDEPWARTLLETMQLEDDQWVVRTAAGQVLDMQDKPNQHIPKPLTELSETPWLITFASERGMGLAPGKASWDMLRTALTEGNEDQRLAAMEYYRHHPEEGKTVVNEFYNFLNGNDSEMKDAAYLTLWKFAVSGISV